MPNRDLDKSFAEQRRDYSGDEISQAQIERGPHILFEEWYKNALEIVDIEVNAMCLSTVSKEGTPSSRMLLLKGYGESGFCFYTNYNSRKGRELLENPKACLLFYWGAHERQIRISGSVARMSSDESDKYFNSRPIDSQISAAVSPQSTEIQSRAELVEMRKEFEEALKGSSPSRPKHWGGYRLTPNYFEFWQGQVSRFHDRVAFSLSDGKWVPTRLAP